MKKLFYLPIFFLLFSFFSNAQPYIIEDFKVDISIDEKGSMEVKESITVFFNEERRGIFRYIPYKYKLNDKNYQIKISDFDVIGYKKVVSTERGNKKIRIGDESVYLTGRRQYDISYSVENAIIEYEDGQEFYWNLTGNEWDTEIQNASFEINLPKGIELDSEMIRVHTGRAGTTESNANYSQRSSKLIAGNITQGLKSGEGATIAVLLPKGYLEGLPNLEVVKKPKLDKAKNKPWFVLFPLLLLMGIRQWWYNLRNRNKVKNEIVPQAYPPEGLTSAHVGAYIDHKVDTRDVISLIPYWATEGFIKVQGTEDGDMILFKEQDLPTDYPEYEKDFFHEIFKNRDSISLSDAKHKFGMAYHKVRGKIVKELEAAGYYDANYSAQFKSWRWPILCLLIIAAGILTIIFWKSVVIGVGLIVVGLALFFLSLFTAPLSPFGQEVHDKLKGLELFMKAASEDEIRATLEKDPDYFGRMLPFAVALGLDKQWLKTFGNIYDVAPMWYIMPHYGHRPTFTDFSNNFQVKEITRAFTSMPIADGTGGGSSFSSGGFSGGGFGGGGGGSW